MFGLGLPELIVIFVIALVVFGPKKLPELGKALGKGIAEFKKATEDVKESIQSEMRSAEKSIDLAKLKSDIGGGSQQGEQKDAAAPAGAPDGPAASAQTSPDQPSKEKASDANGAA